MLLNSLASIHPVDFMAPVYIIVQIKYEEVLSYVTARNLYSTPYRYMDAGSRNIMHLSWLNYYGTDMHVQVMARPHV